MHNTPVFSNSFSASCQAQENSHRQRFGGLKADDSSSTFHFAARFHKLISLRGVWGGLGGGTTGVVKRRRPGKKKCHNPSWLRHRRRGSLQREWRRRLISSCIYSFTTGASLWAHAVTDNSNRLAAHRMRL